MAPSLAQSSAKLVLAEGASLPPAQLPHHPAFDVRINPLHVLQPGSSGSLSARVAQARLLLMPVQYDQSKELSGKFQYQAGQERSRFEQFELEKSKSAERDLNAQLKSLTEQYRLKYDVQTGPKLDEEIWGGQSYIKENPLLGRGKIPLQRDPRREMPIAGQSVINTIELDRPTNSVNLCALQRAYGIARTGCTQPDRRGGSAVSEKNQHIVFPLQCTPKLTSDWGDSQQMVLDLTETPIPELVRTYLRDRLLFNYNRTKLGDAVIAHVERTKELLDACFQPVETSSFAQRTKVLDMIGKIIVGTEAVCTATFAGTSQYILTARHCFSNIPAALKKERVWFQPASSSDRYQVCAVAEANALDTEKTSDITRDQVLARIAAESVVPKPVNVLLPAKLLSTTDEAKGNTSAPTLLTTVSFFPLAALLRPQQYKSGFVQEGAGICAAVSLQKGCFTHVCNAVHGGSGAPIFVLDAPQPVLAGTHVGGSNEKGLECKSEFNTRSNSGVPMNGVYIPELFQ